MSRRDRQAKPERRAFYFGCLERPGHFLFAPGPVQVSTRGLLVAESPQAHPVIPWGWRIDGGLLRGWQTQEQGRAVVAVDRDAGWTALSFWDRSVDPRPGSCSTFVFEGELEPEAALARARELFPSVFARLGFEVTV